MSRTFYKAIVKEVPEHPEVPGNMLKDAEFLRLWDVYGPLLTARQREIADLYFNYDLSLGEIAEEKGVSRQSVSDCLHKCRAQLRAYEEKLGFSKALEEVSLDFSRCLTRVQNWIAAQRSEHPGWGAALDDLQDALESGAEPGIPDESGAAGDPAAGGTERGNGQGKE